MVADQSAAEQVPPTRRPAVLVVEDDAAVRQIAAEILSEAGFEICTAENASQALAVLQTEQEVDLLFSDIIMPGDMTGVDLARRAMHLRPKLQILLTSGYAREALETRHAIGEDIAFLAKPYRPATLSTAVHRLIEQQ